MFKLLTTLGLFLSISVFAFGSAQARPHNKGDCIGMSAENRIEKRLETLQTRLNLSQEQAEQIRAIMETGRDEHRDIAARYGVDMKDRESRQQLEPEKKQQMRDEMRQLRDDHHSKIETILNDDQVAEWKKIQNERHANMKQKRHGKKGQGEGVGEDRAKPE